MSHTTHHVLFVCRANHSRSPWAEEWFNSRCRDGGIDAVARSAGIATAGGPDGERQPVALTRDLCAWADVIAPMTSLIASFVQNRLARDYRLERRILRLDIPDNFVRDAIDDESLARLSPDEARRLLHQTPPPCFGPVFFDRVLSYHFGELLRKRR